MNSLSAQSDTLDHEDQTTLDVLRELLPRVSDGPGVYLMRDTAGEIIYVGKACSLRKRIGSYLSRVGRLDAKTEVLIRKIADIDTIVTSSEKEALILESTLIKRHRPRYNVDLKDDKRYPFLRLDVSHPYPRLSIVRKPQKDGARYFGPYASAHAVRQTLKIINKTFMLRKCKEREFKLRTRPCLHCQMQGCLAPCCRDVDRAEYDHMVKEVILFLEGKTPILIRDVKQAMLAAAGRHDFEQAARLRDKMFALEKTVEKQVAVSTDFKDRDVIACARTADFSLVTMLFVRGGFLQGSRSFTFSATIADDGDLIATFIRQYYASAPFIPKEILVPVLPEDAVLLEEGLRELKGVKVELHRPLRGAKARLVAMALQNVAKDIEEQSESQSGRRAMLQRLQKRLRLQRLPRRIECFDNSNLAGTSAVAGMAVFSDGHPEKAAYRLYRIKGVSTPDDYAMMDEVLRRRFARHEAALAYPDLLIVDGGKGQLNVACAVIKDLGLTDRFDIVAIAKKEPERGETEDRIFKPGRANPVTFGRDGDLLLFLQRVRDEAHRSAVSYHRKRRNRETIRSDLDLIPGVGKKRKSDLLKHFKSVEQLRKATLEELCAVPGIQRKLALSIRESLQKFGPP